MNSNNLLEQRGIQYNNRRENGEKIDFEDLKFLLDIHEEFVFFYNNKMYEIVWCEEGLEFYQEQNTDFSKEAYELYSNGEDFLSNARIEGKTIEEILKDVVF